LKPLSVKARKPMTERQMAQPIQAANHECAECFILLGPSVVVKESAAVSFLLVVSLSSETASFPRQSSANPIVHGAVFLSIRSGRTKMYSRPTQERVFARKARFSFIYGRVFTQCRGGGVVVSPEVQALKAKRHFFQ